MSASDIMPGMPWSIPGIEPWPALADGAGAPQAVSQPVMVAISGA